MILADAAGHPADQLRDARADADPAAGTVGADHQRREPVVPGARRAPHLPWPPGRRRRDADPSAARRGRGQRHCSASAPAPPSPAPAPRPSNASRSPSWPPASSARRSRRRTSSARRCAAPPPAKPIRPPSRPASRRLPRPGGMRCAPTRWPSGPSRPSGCGKTTRAAWPGKLPTRLETAAETLAEQTGADDRGLRGPAA